MNHRRVLDQEQFGEELTPQDLGQALGDLRYDSLSDYVAELANKLCADANNDRAKGRAQLSELLDETALHLHAAVNSLRRAWRICEPKMKKKKGTCPSGLHTGRCMCPVF